MNRRLVLTLALFAGLVAGAFAIARRKPDAAATRPLFAATDQVVYLAATQTLTNKTISGSSNTLSNVTATGLSIASQAQGDVLYFNGSAWTRLGAGTAGYFLETQGASANPQWFNPSTRLLFSPVDTYVARAIANSTGSFSSGYRFYAPAGGTLKGVRVYYSHTGGPYNIKVSLWNSGGSRVANQTQSVTSGAATEIDFSSPQSLTASASYWQISAWETSGAIQLASNLSLSSGTSWPASTNAEPWTAGGTILYAGPYYASGDAAPSSLDTAPESDEPVFQ